jgi:hypothetical protein
MHDYTTSFLTDATPDEVFAAINNVRGWWGRDVDGTNDKVGDEFTFRVQDVHYSKLRVTDLLPNEKIVWLVLDNRMNFVDDQSEWVGTMITFEIAHDGAQTEVRFAHVGLTTEYQCFETCSNAWTSLMHGSLPSLIETGAGQPYE